MLKRKDMRRTDWRRILQREYRFAECSYQGKRGISSILLLQKVTEPLTIHYEHGDVTIVNEGDTWLQIAFQDSFYWVTAMFDRNNDLLQIYFDITNGNRLEPQDNPTFDDLYLDIVMEPDGTLHVLDRDELDGALMAGEITPELHQKAIHECDRLYAFLDKHWQEFAAFCCEQMMKLKETTKAHAFENDDLSDNVIVDTRGKMGNGIKSRE